MIAEGTTSNGKIIAMPTAAYAQALHYNRALFSQAGLDPNKPPTTWAEVAADAKEITQKTGKAGYVRDGQGRQHRRLDPDDAWCTRSAAGWRPATARRPKATLNNPQTVAALNMLHTMRWADNSMGSNFDYGWSDINQAFAAGQGRDVRERLRRAHEPGAGEQHRSQDLRCHDHADRHGDPKAAVLGGGTLAAVRPDAKADQLAAAVKWIDFYYEQPL